MKILGFTLNSFVFWLIQTVYFCNYTNCNESMWNNIVKSSWRWQCHIPDYYWSYILHEWHLQILPPMIIDWHCYPLYWICIEDLHYLKSLRTYIGNIIPSSHCHPLRYNKAESFCLNALSLSLWKYNLYARTQHKRNKNICSKTLSLDETKTSNERWNQHDTTQSLCARTLLSSYSVSSNCVHTKCYHD